MDPQAFVELVLEDEGLTGDLDEAAATCLIEQLTIAVKSLVAKASDEDEAGTMVAKARKNGRALARIAAHFQDGDTFFVCCFWACKKQIVSYCTCE
jgi:hypothetical protein